MNNEISRNLCCFHDSESEKRVMLLNVAFQKNGGDEILENGYVAVQKRSGFVSSENYSSKMVNADGFVKKKDFFVFKAGSCFAKKFEGAIFNVSQRGAHKVYRYAVPLFWRLG